MRRLNKIFAIGNRLRAVAFVAGFAMMAFELVAARLLAPTIGNSTYTWTCVIGVIMAALSLGYFLGGRLADQRGRVADVALLMQITALLVLVALFANASFTTYLAENIIDQRAQGLLASLILFAPASVVIGMISPYLVKLASTSLKTLGRTAAGLSTWNAIGSITGTFVTGFILFALIGSWQSLSAIALLLLAASWLMPVRDNWKTRLGFTVVLLSIISGAIALNSSNATSISIDTASANYRVHFQDAYNGQVVYLTSSPSGAQSAVYSEDPDKMLFWYTNEFVNIADITPRPRGHMLVLGGGTFTVPRYLAEKYPDATVDVVEIDPGLKQIAQDYFFFEQPANLNMYFEDARAFVNKTNNQYDLIFVDVYNGVSIPWQFTTMEYAQKLAGILSDDGIVAVNVIANDSGICKPLLDGLNAPYAANFSHRQYTVDKSNKSDSKNMILVYSKRKVRIDDYKKLDVPEQRPFTDNFAPIEPLQSGCSS
ncbi:fused MFS/spermidine synthase [Candidatus Saccharibacteria bacterium]|nr:fused MFS/spermidine synthase [Candidatus Saccharibacteria bacterium]